MITPILNLHLDQTRPKINSPQRQSLTLRPQLSADTVSFGNTVPDLMELPDSEIYKKVKQALKDEDILGCGGEAEVYRIADSNYCVRKVYIINNEDDTLKRKAFSRNISSQDKINHVVAKFGDRITIMPILEGIPVKSVRMSDSETAEISSQIETFPQSAFHKLLRQISEAYDKNMMWDCNWSNLIVNPSKKTLTAIDFYKNVENEPASHLAYMFAGLTHDVTTEQQCKVFAEKIMNAGLEELKPGVKSCCRFDKFGFPDLIRCMEDLELFTNKKYTKLLRQLTYKIRDLKILEFRGEDVANEINGQIKMIKAIMRQLVKY